MEDFRWMIEPEEAIINRVEWDVSWEEDMLVIDLKEEKQLEPVNDTIDAEPDEVVAAEFWRKLEKLFQRPHLTDE